MLVLTEFPPRIGGMQTHALNLVRHLHRKKYPMEVMTYQPGDIHEARAVHSVDRRIPCPVRRQLSRLGYANNLKVLENRCRQFKPDLVYASTVFYGSVGHSLGIPTLARSVGNDVMRPWIAYPYDFASRWAGHPLLERRLYQRFRRLEYPEAVEIMFRRKRRELMMASARQYDKILANSHFTHGLLRNIGVHKSNLLS